MAHITGGSFFKNVGRILPKNLSAAIKKGAWKVPSLFSLIQRTGNISEDEMYHVFNMGIGLIAIVSKGDAEKCLRLLKGDYPSASIIGGIKKGIGEVILEP